MLDEDMRALSEQQKIRRALALRFSRSERMSDERLAKRIQDLTGWEMQYSAKDPCDDLIRRFWKVLPRIDEVFRGSED